jgi:multidrug efflux pump subunit AcrB
MNKLIEIFAKQKIFPELITILVIVGGLFALSSIRRESFPNVEFDTVMITTIYPGASPKEVERLISSPLEEDLREIVGIKKMFSVSVESRSEIIIQVDPDQTTTDEVKDDAQLIIDRFQDIPEDSEDPIVTVIESKIMPIIEVSVSSDMNATELKKVAKYIEKEVERIPEVSSVSISGDKKYEYRIEIDMNKLSKNDISLQEILLALRETNVTIPAGDFTIQNQDQISKEIVVRTTGEFQNIDDIKNLVLRTSDLGNSIKLSDLAEIKFTLADSNMGYRAAGKSSLRLIVKKKEKADAINLVNNLKAKMKILVKSPELKGVSVDFINDSSFYIKNRLKILTSNLVVGLFLVLGILSLFLPFRVALVVSMGIPFSFLVTIWIFHYLGFSLNLISVMGLIIVIGMLVDDAIVVIENSFRYMEEGLSPTDAAIKGTQTIWKAVFASVMTTILAFWPMTMISGIFGKFVQFIPYAVIIALVTSMVEAYFILPSHFARWVGDYRDHKPPKFKQKFEIYWKKFVSSYVGLLKFSIARRYLVLLGFVVFFIVSVIFSAKNLKFILFPPDGIEAFVIKLESPRGSTLNQTELLLLPVENEILKIPPKELMNYIISIGEHNSNGDPAGTKRGTNYAQATVYLTPENKRSRTADEIIEELKTNIGSPSNLKIIFTRLKPGPPVGSPVNIGIRGESFDDINHALEDIKSEISKWPGVKDLDSNYKLAKDERILKYKPREASMAGLTVQTIGTNVRALYEGVIPTTMRGKDEEIDLRVTFKEDQKSIDLLDKLKIMNSRGVLVPLNQITEIEESIGIESIYHEAAERQFTISGDVDTKITSALEVSGKAKEWINKNIQPKYPDLNFVYGGENEDTDESLGSLKKTFLLALFLIFFILIVTFENFYQPFLIIAAIPLGVVSVLWTLFLHNKPISFMAMLGIIALAGVIVNNAIVFIDFVNEGRKDGLSPEESVLRAGQLRLRAVVLTSSTTVLGLLPTAYGIGGLDKFVVPIALSLGWGMLIGSIMVMFFIPVLIVTVEDFRGWLFKKN